MPAAPGGGRIRTWSGTTTQTSSSLSKENADPFLRVRISLLAVREKIKRASALRLLFLAAGEGFEPSQTESESVVLPLHNPAIFGFLFRPLARTGAIIRKAGGNVNSFFKIF